MLKKYILNLIVFVIFILIIFLNCQQASGGGGGGSSGGGGDGDDPVLINEIYAIEDIGPSGVGIVFYITDGGLHGLEAAPSLWKGGAADPTEEWITGGATRTTLNGNTLTGIGTGLANSNVIIAQTGHIASAAKLCRDYTGGGKTDWFLPSKDELAEMRSALASTSGDRTTYGFDDYYWSSSEIDAFSSNFQAFSNGNPGLSSKGNPEFVRAVRAF